MSVYETVHTEIPKAIAFAREQFGIAIPDIQVLVNLRGRAAGMAYLSRGLIRINPDITGDEECRATCWHEVAHFVAWIRFRCRDHSAAWQRVMTEMGFPPTRCHNMDLPPARTVARSVWKCPCGKSYNLTSIKVNQLKKDPRRWVCSTCHRTLQKEY